MPDQKVNIENLTIRLPEKFKDEAHDIGQEVAQNLSIKFSGHHKPDIYGSINNRVTISNHTTRSQLTTLITDAILKGLG